MSDRLLKTIIVILFTGFFLGIFQLTGYAAGDRVPLDVSRRAALQYAEEIFGPVRCWNHATYYDPADEPIVYVFTLYRIPGPLPDLEKIKSKVNISRGKRLDIERGINNDPFTSIEEKKAKIDSYWKAMRMEEAFVTVTASAVYSQVPVLQVFAGLPPHIAALEDARDSAGSVLDKNSLRLEKLYYIAPSGFEFEFSDHIGKCILVSPLDFKIRDASLLRQSRPADTGLSPERQRMIEEKWNSLFVDTADSSSDGIFTTSSDRWVYRGRRGDEEPTLLHPIIRDSGKIEGVPDYQKIDFVGLGDCAPIAAACVLGYWFSHGYSQLIKGGDVARLVRELEENGDYDFSKGGESLETLADSIEIVCNDPDLNRNYGFSATCNRNNSFLDFKDEILAGRPLILSCLHLGFYGDHSMAGVGFVETLKTKWCITHDNWKSTPEDVYFNWDLLNVPTLTKIEPGFADNKEISGYARTMDGLGIPGITITFSHYDYHGSVWIVDGTAVTTSSGYYSFQTYYCWSGRSVPARSDFSFSPGSISYDDITSNLPNQDYTSLPARAAGTR